MNNPDPTLCTCGHDRSWHLNTYNFCKSGGFTPATSPTDEPECGCPQHSSRQHHCTPCKFCGDTTESATSNFGLNPGCHHQPSHWPFQIDKCPDVRPTPPKPIEPLTYQVMRDEHRDYLNNYDLSEVGDKLNEVIDAINRLNGASE